MAQTTTHTRMAHWFVLSLLSILALTGCATTASTSPASQQQALVQEGQQAIAEAADNTDVQRYAPDLLAEAQAHLAAAQQAEDVTETNQHVYLAKQTAQLAITKAEQQVSTAENSQLQATKQAALAEQQRQQRLAQAAKAKAEAAERARSAQLKAVKAQQTAQGILVTLDEPYFVTDRMLLTSTAQGQIKKIADLFRQYAQHHGSIEAVVNTSGSADYLQGISQRLADAVLYALVEQGVASNRLTATGLGARRLNAASSGGMQRQVNILLTPTR